MIKAINKASAQDLNFADEMPLTKAALKYINAAQLDDVDYTYKSSLEYIIKSLLLKGANPEKLDKNRHNFLFYISENAELLAVYNEVQQIFNSKVANEQMVKELGIEAQTPRARRASIDKANQPLVYEHYDKVSKDHINDIIKVLKVTIHQFMDIAAKIYATNNYDEFILELSEGGLIYKIKSGRVKPGRTSDLANCKKFLWQLHDNVS